MDVEILWNLFLLFFIRKQGTCTNGGPGWGTNRRALQNNKCALFKVEIYLLVPYSIRGSAKLCQPHLVLLSCSVFRTRVAYCTMEEERHRDCTLSVDIFKKEDIVFQWQIIFQWANGTLFFNGKTKEDECLSSSE